MLTVEQMISHPDFRNLEKADFTDRYHLRWWHDGEAVAKEATDTLPDLLACFTRYLKTEPDRLAAIIHAWLTDGSNWRLQAEQLRAAGWRVSGDFRAATMLWPIADTSQSDIDKALDMAMQQIGELVGHNRKLQLAFLGYAH
jgi:hypothetical protein